MMKKILFCVLLGILGIILFIESRSTPTEGFQATVPMEVPLTQPPPQPIAAGDPQPFVPPSSTLLSPPPGQTASVNSYPAKDPSLEPATTKRIQGVYEALKGFSQNEMDGLTNLGDPSVALPLESLKADLRRLQDEHYVLAKNPGVESTLTEDDVAGMEANLRYLQQKWRLSANSESGVVEGFAGPTGSRETSLSGKWSYGPTGSKMAFAGSMGATGSRERFQNRATGPTGSRERFQNRATGPTGSRGPASMRQGPTGSRERFQNRATGPTGTRGSAGRQVGPTGTSRTSAGIREPFQDSYVWLPTGSTGSTGSTGASSYWDWTNTPYSTGSTGSTGASSYWDWTNTPYSMDGPTGSMGPDWQEEDQEDQDQDQEDQGPTKILIENVKLNMDFASLGASGSPTYTNFVSTFLNDVSKAIYAPISRLQIESVQPGSVMVSFSILPGQSSSDALANAFLSAAASPGSLLYAGTVTNKMDPSSVPTSSVVPVAAGPSAMVPASPANGPGPGVPGPTGPSGSGQATLAQLKDLVVKLSAEVMRLQASGTTDPLITKRVAILTDIRQNIQEIIRQVESGALLESKIPITAASYQAFLPAMGNVGMPLPTLLSQSGMSSALNSLFPLFMPGDISGAALAKSLFEKYAGDLGKNISWDIDIRYTSDAEASVASEIAKGILGPDTGESNGAAPPTGYRGGFDSDIKRQMGATGGAPSVLDWKVRSEQICQQAKLRGLNPYDYGCLKSTDDVGSDFSFRGYAKMICSRLSTNYDPGIPEMCGCPPPTWAGWRG